MVSKTLTGQRWLAETPPCLGRRSWSPLKSAADRLASVAIDNEAILRRVVPHTALRAGLDGRDHG